MLIFFVQKGSNDFFENSFLRFKKNARLRTLSEVTESSVISSAKHEINYRSLQSSARTVQRNIIYVVGHCPCFIIRATFL